MSDAAQQPLVGRERRRALGPRALQLALPHVRHHAFGDVRRHGLEDVEKVREGAAKALAPYHLPDLGLGELGHHLHVRSGQHEAAEQLSHARVAKHCQPLPLEQDRTTVVGL